jgi:hypothetical protein
MPVPEDGVAVDSVMLRDVEEKSSKLVCVASVAVLELETETEKFALHRHTVSVSAP